MRSQRDSAVWSAFLALLCCTSPTAPTFTTSITTVPLYSSLPALSVDRSADTLRISWWIGTNEPCYDFAAAAAARHDTLVVTVEANRRDGFCEQVGADFSYTVTVIGVSSAQHALRVMYDRHGPPTYVETALEQPLAAP